MPAPAALAMAPEVEEVLRLVLGVTTSGVVLGRVLGRMMSTSGDAAATAGAGAGAAAVAAAARLGVSQTRSRRPPGVADHTLRLHSAEYAPRSRGSVAGASTGRRSMPLSRAQA